MRIGIDCGVTGAIAFLNDDLTPIKVVDMPVFMQGKHQEVNGAALARILEPEITFVGALFTQCYVEEVGSRPGQGVVSMFNFGTSYGIVLGVVESLNVPLIKIRPQSWKKKAGLIGKPKESARTLAQQLYPEQDLSLKKHVGRADALLIARFGFLC